MSPVPAPTPETTAAAAFVRGPLTPPEPSQIPVRAGSLTAVLCGIDLAHVASGEVELARLIQVAVRDEAWGTVPPVVSDLCVERSEDAFPGHVPCALRDWGDRVRVERANRGDAWTERWPTQCRASPAGPFATAGSVSASFIRRMPTSAVAIGDGHGRGRHGRVSAGDLRAASGRWGLRPSRGPLAWTGRGARAGRDGVVLLRGRRVRDGGSAQLDRRVV